MTGIDEPTTAGGGATASEPRPAGSGEEDRGRSAPGEELAAEQRKYQSMVDGLGMGVAFLNADLEILELNRRAREWFPGLAAGERCRCLDVFFDEPRAAPPPDCPVAAVLRDGIPHEVTLQREIGGEPRYFRLIASPVQDDDGQIAGVIEVFDDITERLSLEEQLRQSQKLEAIGTLAAGVAHDLNNTLATVMAVATYVQMGELSPAEHREAMIEIVDACRRGASLTEGLLGFSRRRSAERIPFAPAAVVRGVAGIVRRTVPKRISTSVEILEPLGQVEGDPGLLQQAVINLCLNAVDAMPGPGRLVISAREGASTERQGEGSSGAPARRLVRISVRDSGGGMAPEIKDRVCEPFFTTKPAGRGTGLGLTMVRSIVDKHSGSLRIESEPDVGTEVTLELPTIVGTGEAPRSTDARVTDASPLTGTVLLVDDELAVRRSTARLLQAAGYEVIAASGGREAIALFAERRRVICAVLLDLMMPDVDGEETLEALIALDASVPVVIISGHAQPGVLRRLRQRGARGFLPKPYDLFELRSALEKALEGDTSPKA